MLFHKRQSIRNGCRLKCWRFKDVRFSSVSNMRCVLSFQRRVFVCVFACTHASVPVKMYACVCEGLCVPTRMCLAACVFLGVFSGRELSGMMTDVTLVIHTPTHAHTKTHISWQVKAVCYLENREVIQTNCTCFWNGLTSNYTGRATHTQIAKFNSRQIIGK